jgi:hypothetical protein
MKKIAILILLLAFVTTGYSQQQTKLNNAFPKDPQVKDSVINGVKCKIWNNLIHKDLVLVYEIWPSSIHVNKKDAENFIKAMKKEYKIKAKEEKIIDRDTYIIHEVIDDMDYSLCYDKKDDRTYQVFLSVRNKKLFDKLKNNINNPK